MTLDPEIKAMSDIVSALEDLEDEQVTRVLAWAQQRYSVPQGSMVPPASERAVPGDVKSPADTSGLVELHDLVEATGPETQLERVLVAAYWFQEEKNQETFAAGPLNRELKHLGYPSSNITRDLNKLMKRSPILVMKVRKEGLARQARNRYKLTSAGIGTVTEMLAKSSDQVSAPLE